MAVALWACDLVPWGPAVRNSRAPRVYSLWANLPDPKPRIAWSITSGDARPRAVGLLVGVTSGQITTLNAQAGVWARELPTGWRQLTWGSVPAAMRTKMTTVLGQSPGVANGDLLPTALRKILASLDDGSVIDPEGLAAAVGGGA